MKAPPLPPGLTRPEKKRLVALWRLRPLTQEERDEVLYLLQAPLRREHNRSRREARRLKKEADALR